MVTEIGEYFEEEFGWKLKNCAIYVRLGSKRQGWNPKYSPPLVWTRGAPWVATGGRETTVRLSLGAIVAVGGVRAP